MSKIKNFFLAIKKEKDETVYMCRLIYAMVFQKRILTESQKLIVKNQLKDVLKTLLMVIIFFLPFGSLMLIGISFFSFSKYLFPSAFSKDFLKKNLTF